MDDLSVRTYVRACVGLCSALWKNRALDPDAVWHHRSDGSTDEAGSGVWRSVHGKRYFGGEFGARHCNEWGLYGVRVRQHRDAALFPNYFAQTCLEMSLRIAINNIQLSLYKIIYYHYTLYTKYIKVTQTSCELLLNGQFLLNAVYSIILYKY